MSDDEDYDNEFYDKRYADEMPELEDEDDLSMKAFAGKELEAIIEEHDPSPPPEKLDAEWVDRDRLLPNDWNPNHMPTHLEDALVLSVLDNGWTAPILAKPDDSIVDGEHRWRIAGHEQLRDRDDLTPDGVPAGYVPVHYVDMDKKQAMLATYQQNYARGEHNTKDMEQLVSDVHEDDKDDVLATRMGASESEIEHLLPDTETADVTEDDLEDDPPWEKPWDDEMEDEYDDSERYGEPIRLDMLEEEAGLVKWLVAGDSTKLEVLATFVEEHDIDQAVGFE